MPTIICRKKDFDRIKDALSILTLALSADTAQAYLASIDVQLWQEQQQHQQQQDQRPRPSNAELEHRKRQELEQQTRALTEQRVLVEHIVSAVEEQADRTKLPPEKKEEFTLPAYKALAEYKLCVSSNAYPAFMCLGAFLITLASIVMPFANPHGKEK